MAVFTNIVKKRLSWAASAVFSGTRYFLEIGSDYRLDIGDGYKLIIQSGGERTATPWTPFNKTR